MTGTFTRRKRSTTIGVDALLTLTGAGAAFAYWTSTGTATVTLANTGVNQDDCQGQTVPLCFVAS